MALLCQGARWLLCGHWLLGRLCGAGEGQLLHVLAHAVCDVLSVTNKVTKCFALFQVPAPEPALWGPTAATLLHPATEAH